MKSQSIKSISTDTFKIEWLIQDQGQIYWLEDTCLESRAATPSLLMDLLQIFLLLLNILIDCNKPLNITHFF